MPFAGGPLLLLLCRCLLAPGCHGLLEKRVPARRAVVQSKAQPSRITDSAPSPQVNEAGLSCRGSSRSTRRALRSEQHALRGVAAGHLLPRRRRGRDRGDPSVLYLAMPSSVAPDQRAERHKAIMDTWGRSGKVVFVRAGPNGTFSPPGEATPSGDAWTPLFEWALAQPGPGGREWEWLMRIDDISVVVDGNLKHLLSSYDPGRPVMIGSKLMIAHGGSHLRFSGGPGYVCSRAAVQKVLQLPPPEGQFLTKRAELAILSRLLKDSSITVVDGLDERGGQMFSVYSPVRAFHGGYDDWYLRFKAGVPEEVKTGLDCCAAYPISFHYTFQDEIRAIYDAINNRARWKRMTPEERAEAWPGGTRVSRRSRQMKGGLDPAWELMLEKFRVHGKEEGH